MEETKIDLKELEKIMKETGKSLGSGIRHAIQLSKQKPPPIPTPLKRLTKSQRG